MNETKKSTFHISFRILIPAAIFWGISFVTDTRIFSSDGLNMNCLPIDEDMILPMHILTKLLVLLFWLAFFSFLKKAFGQKHLLMVFCCLLAVYAAGLLATYPGYYMNDDPIIFAYATRFLPVYWHNYLTSLFYMTAMSIFPASCGPVLLSDVCYAYVYTFIFAKGYALLKKPSPVAVALLIAPALLPFTLLGSLMCFRPAIYASFFLYYFMYLYFEHLQQAVLTPGKLLSLSFLTALLCLWRSESIVLLPLSAFLIPLTYASGGLSHTDPSKDADNAKKSRRQKKMPGSIKSGLIFFVLVLCFYSLISQPQKQGEKKYYGSDYLIISTTRPLSVILWRDQTYEGADEDISNISAVTDFGYLHNDSLSCSAYNRYNSDHNEGRYTQTGADALTQQKYLKSALRLLLHNPDLYFGERLQLFCVTNGIWNYNTDMVLNLKPVISSDFHLYEHDRDYGFEMLDAFRRLPLSYHKGYADFLFKAGGEAFLPMLMIAFAALIVSIFRKNAFYFFFFSALLARELVIFLTAPASFIQYSYPTMYVVAAVSLCSLALKAGLFCPSCRTKDTGRQESSPAQK